jgi:hypothetical protein
MNCQKALIYISGKLDNELTTEQQQQLDKHIATCQNCRKEYEELMKLKEVTSDMRFSDLPDRYWAGYWNKIYNRLERGIGWIFVSIGAIILIAFGIWELLNSFFLDETVPIALRIGVGFGLLGLIILLVSILREKLFAREHERYKEVQR